MFKSNPYPSYLVTWVTLMVIIQVASNDGSDCGNGFRRRGRYYDGFMIDSSNESSTYSYSDVFQCDNVCKPKEECKGISFNKVNRVCKFYNIEKLNNLRKLDATSIVILYMPITCSASSTGAWSAWTTNGFWEYNFQDNRCLEQFKRTCDEVTPGCIVDFCEGDDTEYIFSEGDAGNLSSLSVIPKTGIYCFHVGSRIVPLYCERDENGTVWVHIQRRVDGTVDFFRNWYNYTEGFGDLLSNFWLGNSNIHRLTKENYYLIRFEMSDGKESRYAEYEDFIVGNIDIGFRLTIDKYSGTAGDAMKKSNLMKFSTIDNTDSRCANAYKGGWWYEDCHHCNPNGLYLYGSTYVNGRGITWEQWKGQHFSMFNITMKIRRKEIIPLDFGN